MRRDTVLRHLVDIQYERNDTTSCAASSACAATRSRSSRRTRSSPCAIEFFGDEVERIIEIDPLTGEMLAERDTIEIYPA